MTTQHTQQWHVDARTGYDVLDSNGNLVANCGGWQESHNPMQDSIKKANARLISSAPALLEAAREAIRTAEAAQGVWAGVLLPYAPEWTEPYKGIIETLETAIAAAEGRTP